MQPDAHLVNVARGPMVDEAALLEALTAARIGGATLDVFDTEPLPPGHPLWDAPNVTVTAHMSADAVGWRDSPCRTASRRMRGAGWPASRCSTWWTRSSATCPQERRHDRVGHRTRRRAIGTSTISPVEATEAALDAIDSYDDRVNAFVLVDREGALAAAKESEARWHSGEPLGPGDGVPTSIKDALWTRGWPTLRGSTLIDAAGPWDEDAPCVARLRETGAVILGKTTTPEYSWKGVTDSLRHGATGNPWDPAMTSGGSSGGSATAVGLGMGAWSVGTDGGGSVRIPAAFTGTVALKPTYGLIPFYPPSPFGTLSHAGPMTRTRAGRRRADST